MRTTSIAIYASLGSFVVAGALLLACGGPSPSTSPSSSTSPDASLTSDGGIAESPDADDDRAVDARSGDGSNGGDASDASSEASVPIVKMSVGGKHGCAITALGSAVCLGNNDDGELGRGTMGGTSFDVVTVWGLARGVTDIAVAQSSTCALTGGSVECWGAGDLGQLGTGDRSPRFVPTQVSGLATGVVAMSTARNSACAIVASGKVRCWGSNQYGQLGTNAAIDDCGGVPCATTPVEITGLPRAAIAISVGDSFACAILTGGSVMCWGDSEFGQLGAGPLATQCSGLWCSPSPLQVEGLTTGVIALSTGTLGACALTSAGDVMCWGASDQEQLGKGSSAFSCNGHVCSSTPVKIAGLPNGITEVSAAGFVSCAIALGGDVLCWGGNYYGTLGNGSTTKLPSSDPVQPLGLTSGVTNISASGSVCAVVAGGHVECWGFASIWTAFDTRYAPAPINGL